MIAFLYSGKDFSRGNIRQYLLARSGRVIPLYFLIVIVSYILYQFGFQGFYLIDDESKLIGHLLFLYGESVLWTIAPEIQFYIIFIGFWFLISWRVGYVYLIIVSMMIILFFCNFLKISGDIGGIHYNFFHLFRSLPFFFVGMLLGMHYKTIKVPSYLRKNLFLAALLLIPLLYPQFSPVEADAKMKMWLSYEVLLVMSAVFFAIVFLVPDDNIFLSNGVWDFLGKISYSLYLLHMPIIVAVNEYDLSVTLKVVLSTLISIFLSYLSFRYFERPVSNFIRKV